MPERITFQHFEVLLREDGTPWELGRGAMGVTYKAIDTNLRVPVALKVIHPRQLDSEVAAQRFVREARAAARLRHPNIAAVYHLGREQEAWFYSMEFVAGDTAEAVVKSEGTLPESVVLSVAAQTARALQAAEALGLVHRDIKPSNLMLTREGEDWHLKLIDFGLARAFAGEEAADEDLAAVTMSGFVGTPYYSSPEQLEMRKLDIRADFYSLGVTLWFLLTGRVPFTGSVMSVASQHLSKPPPIDQLGGIASPATVGLIERLLKKNPADRPQTARDLRHQIEDCQRQLGGASIPSAATAAPPAWHAPTPSQAPTAAEAEDTRVDPSTAIPKMMPAVTPSEVIEEEADLGFGRIFRARDTETGAARAVVRLDREWQPDAGTLARLKRTIEVTSGSEHREVWQVLAVESTSDGWQIAMEWIDGISWRELLRQRRELSPPEAFTLLRLAARGADALLAAGLDRPDVEISGLWCSTEVPGTGPPGVKVSPLGFLRSDLLGETWNSDRTVVSAPAASGGEGEGGVPGAVRASALIAYQMLGGVANTLTFSPLPALSESANSVLQTALRAPETFKSVSAFIEHLSSGETASLQPSAVFEMPDTPTTAALVEDAVGTSAPAEAPAPADEPPLAPELPAEEVADVSAERVAVPAAPPSRRAVVFALAAALLAVAAVGLWKFGPRVWTRPVAKSAAQATVAPVAPVAPTPARKDLALTQKAHAEELARTQQWEKALAEWLAMRAEFPEARAAADVGLELLLREVRWRYTPRSDRPPEIAWAQVEAMRPSIEKAAGHGITAAMLLLGQHYTQKDWKQAVAWYEKARPAAPKASTRLGLLLARNSTAPADLARAWQYFQEAAEAGDLDGKVALADCYIHGNVAGAEVAGLKADAKRGVTMLREIIGSRRDRTDPPFADATARETYATEPTRSKLVLGSYYLAQESAPPEKRPAWYRDESSKIDHGADLRSLLEDASADWAESFSMLGAATAQGIGGPKDTPQAIRYFKQGIARGDPSSMFNYATFLSAGRAVSDIPAEARDLLVRSAKLRHAGAQDFCKRNGIAF